MEWLLYPYILIENLLHLRCQSYNNWADGELIFAQHTNAQLTRVHRVVKEDTES